MPLHEIWRDYRRELAIGAASGLTIIIAFKPIVWVFVVLAVVLESSWPS